MYFSSGHTRSHSTLRFSQKLIYFKRPLVQLLHIWSYDETVSIPIPNEDLLPVHLAPSRMTHVVISCACDVPLNREEDQSWFADSQTVSTGLPPMAGPHASRPDSTWHDAKEYKISCIWYIVLCCVVHRDVRSTMDVMWQSRTESSMIRARRKVRSHWRKKHQTWEYTLHGSH